MDLKKLEKGSIKNDIESILMVEIQRGLKS